MQETRRCPRCEKTQPIAVFYPAAPKTEYQKTAGRPRPWCTACYAEYQREYRKREAADPAKKAARQAWRQGWKKTPAGKAAKRKSVMRRKYGLEPEDVERMLKNQKGRCGICREPFPERAGGRYSPYVVDHRHGTGKPRGLLCAMCNTGLGMFKDDRQRLVAAASYVTIHGH